MVSAGSKVKHVSLVNHSTKQFIIIILMEATKIFEKVFFIYDR